MIHFRDFGDDQSPAPIATGHGILNARAPELWRIRLGRILTVALLSAILVASSLTVAARGAAGTGTPAAGSPVAGQPPADLQVITYQPCDVIPRDYDELMTMIATVYQDPEAFPSLTASVNLRSGPAGRSFLPDGPSPSPETVQTLVELLGTFETCTPLQRAALRPDDLLARSVFTEDGTRIVAGWWRDAHQMSGAPAVRDGQIGTPTIYQLYDFRTIDATHVGAYVELSGGIRLGFNPAAGTYQPSWERDGYVVFTLGPDGRWLIDAFVSPLGSVVDALFPEGSATSAA